jgi:hypothetical protein
MRARPLPIALRVMSRSPAVSGASRVIKWHVTLLQSYIGELKPQQIHDQTLEPFVQARLASGASATTINRSLEVVRTILNRAARSYRDADGCPWLEAIPPLITMLRESPRSGTVKLTAKLPKRPDRMGNVNRLRVLSSVGKVVQRERKAVTQHQSGGYGECTLVNLTVPTPDGLVRDFHAPLEHHLLDVAKAQAEAKVKPYAVGDNLAREAVTTVTRACWGIHPVIASSPAQVDNVIRAHYR